MDEAARSRPGREARGPDPRPEDFVQSVGRALRVLEVVGSRPGLPVKTIARRCDLNISTTYHLVRTLAYENYLHRRPDGTYVIGEGVARRFHELQRSLSRPPDSSTVLRHLVARTGLSAYLGHLDGDRLTVVEVVEGPGSPYLEDFESGLAVSAHATALGKALLAALPRRQRRSYLSGKRLRPFTANTRTDPAVLEDELAMVHRGEAVVEHGEFRDGIACAAGLVAPPEEEGAGWAVAVSTWGEDVPAAVRAELILACADLGGGGR